MEPIPEIADGHETTLRVGKSPVLRVDRGFPVEIGDEIERKASVLAVLRALGRVEFDFM
jgi:hypothetical protein